MMLQARTVTARSLDATTRGRMFDVFAAAFEQVDQATFEADLRPKSHVILLSDTGDGSLQGFSTIETRVERVAGRRVVTIYSGDTVVTEPYWGQTALQRAFLAYVIRRKLRFPLTPVYWFLITKGYKTYLLLSRNFPEYWPRRDRPTPAWQAAVIGHVARARFPEAWRPDRGVLEHPHPKGQLQEGVAPIDAALQADPDVRFFCERNPGHARGDELCCIGCVEAALWVRYMGKLARRALR